MRRASSGKPAMRQGGAQSVPRIQLPPGTRSPRSQAYGRTTDAQVDLPLHDVKQHAPARLKAKAARIRFSRTMHRVTHPGPKARKRNRAPPLMRRTSRSDNANKTWSHPAGGADKRSKPHGEHQTKFGGARRDRTDNLLLAKQALSQLGYGPILAKGQDGSSLASGATRVGAQVGHPRREAPQAQLRARADARDVAKRHASRWWAWEDLNFRPHAYQARALTN